VDNEEASAILAETTLPELASARTGWPRLPD
jgi:hypothetical protein